ncbi:MAG: VanW family protein [Chloroflexota bacterium]
MKSPEGPRGRWSTWYQTAVLALSAAIIIGTWVFATRVFQTTITRPGSVSLGIEAIGQVLGAAAPHGPAASELPGLVGTPTTVAAPGVPVPTLVSTATAPAELSPTATPDSRFYDAARAKTLLAQAQTSFGSQSTEFVANASLASQRVNNREVAPGATFSFNSVAGPYSTDNGYRSVSAIDRAPTSGVPTIEGGITQVSTTLFQAAFWSGLKIVERHTHPYWLDRFNAGSTAQRGLDAYVDYPSNDLRIQNTTGDWIRIESTVKSGSVAVSIFGADPGWSVNPDVGAPTKVVQPNPTQTVRNDPSLPAGQQFNVFPGSAGFDVDLQRTVTNQNETVDRYGVLEHYPAMPGIVVIGEPPTPTATPPPATDTPLPTVPASTAAGPTRLAGLDPTTFVLPDGRIRVPNLVSLSEDEAQKVITAVGLQTTYANYQGPGDVPVGTLDSVPVDHVLSQSPQPGAAAPRGTTIYIAVRRQ